MVRYRPTSHPMARRMQLLTHYGIDLVFDVGASTGQYATEMRDFGYRGRIVSFEPLTSAYAELQRNARYDSLWEAVNIALADRDGEMEINVSANSHSSSIRQMLPEHVRSAPESVFIGKEVIVCRCLDSIIHKYYRVAERLYLKVDTQGYEQNVIQGATESLEQIVGMQLELSLVALYEGGRLLGEMVSWLSRMGYTLMALEPGFSNPTTGQLLQVDGIFWRTGQGSERAV